MEQYNVTGMSCAACVARVEKAVNSVEGVKSCAVNLLTNSMGVEGSALSKDIIKAVKDAGYGASLKQKGTEKSNSKNTDSLEDTETPKLKKRLVYSFIILLPLMYVSMGHMMWNLPLPPFMRGNPVSVGLYELLLSAIVMIINQKFFISGFKGLIHRSPNMDTLVALGSFSSFIYSVFVLFALSSAVLAEDKALISYYMNQFYFESSAMILTLITVGKTLESYSKGKTTNALKALMNLAPETATLLIDGKETVVSVEKVKKGDRFVVRPGEKFAVDGVVIEGESAVNESALTGESVPVDKKAGDEVSAATINTSGFLVCEATRVGEDTTLAGIIQMVSDAAGTKAPIAKIADKVSGVFVPVVIGISLITFIVWLLIGEDFGYVISRAVAVLVISCPCSLGLATPVAIMVGNGVGAKNGVLYKNASSLENLGKTQIIALDKTGTITTGVMQVTDVICAENVSEDYLLQTAFALEAKSEHPISKAVTHYGNSKNIKLLSAEGFEAVAGNGLMAFIDEKKVYGGNHDFISGKGGKVSEALKEKMQKLSGEGKTPVLFACETKVLGVIAVSDTIKQDSEKAVKALKKLGIYTVMLTGDNAVTANAIAKQVGVDEVISGVKPDGKEKVIRSLKEKGNVAMAGDGINDAPALTLADTGIAVGAGTDIAIDSADVVLMKNSLFDVVRAIRISRSTIKNIHENLFWAFFYNLIGIPLAAGVFVKLLGWSLNPMFGAAAMGLSSFCVVTNALRLNFINVNTDKKDKAINNPLKKDFLINNDNLNDKDGNEMKITVKGMMCAHCEAHVKKALEAIDGVVCATANHDENLVTIETSKDVDEALIKGAVAEAGYTYEGIIA